MFEKFCLGHASVTLAKRAYRQLPVSAHLWDAGSFSHEGVNSPSLEQQAMERTASLVESISLVRVGTTSICLPPLK